jgi:transposase InsO family protein
LDRDGTNYKEWFRQLELTAQANGLTRFLTDKPASAPTVPTPEDDAYLKAMAMCERQLAQDGTLKCLIARTIHTELNTRFLKKNLAASEVLKALEEGLNPVSGQRYFMEVMKVLKFSNEPGESITASANRLRDSMLTLLTTYKEFSFEDFIKVLFINNQDSSYSLQKQLILGSNRLPNWEDMLSTLTEREVELKYAESNSGNVALQVRAAGPSKQQQPNRYSKRDDRPLCGSCGKRHNGRCWKDYPEDRNKFEQEQRAKQEQRKKQQQQPAKPQTAYNLMTTTALSSTSTTLTPNDWVVDSGASRHMCPNKTAYSTYRQYHTPSKVYLANGEVAECIGEGDIKLVTDTSQLIQLRGVLHVPSLKANLFSASQATKYSGTDIELSASGSMVTVNGKVLINFVQTDNLWLFQAQIVLPTTTAYNTYAYAYAEAKDAQLWHARFGHTSYSTLSNAVAKGLVNGIPVTASAFAKQIDCDVCVEGKQPRGSFPMNPKRATRPFELVHTDVCGAPSMPAGKDTGAHYIVSIICDFSGYAIIGTISRKSEATKFVKEHLLLIETQTGYPVKRIRHDRGGEYMCEELQAFYVAKGIIPELTPSYTPQLNGRAERFNRTLFDKIRCMLLHFELEKCMWDFAAKASVRVYNNTPKKGSEPTPIERVWGSKPDVSYFRVFGCEVLVQVPKHQRTKLDARTVKGVFVGYTRSESIYRILIGKNVREIASANIVFREHAAAAVKSAPAQLAHFELDPIDWDELFPFPVAPPPPPPLPLPPPSPVPTRTPSSEPATEEPSFHTGTSAEGEDTDTAATAAVPSLAANRQPLLNAVKPPARLDPSYTA